MSWFRNLSLYPKLIVPIAIIAIVVLANAAISVLNFNELTKNTNVIAYEYLKGIDLLLQADRDMYQAQVAERSLIFLKAGSDDYKEQQKQHTSNIKQAKERVAKFAELTTFEEAKAQASAFAEAYAKWEKITLRIEKERTEGGRIGRRTAIELSFNEGANQFDAARDIIDGLTEFLQNKSEVVVSETNELASYSQQTQITAAVIAVIIVIILIVFLPRIIVVPIRTLLARVEDIANGDGDLTVRISENSQDELGKLAVSFNHFLQQLQEIIGRIAGSSSQVATAAEELSAITAEVDLSIKQQHTATDQVATAVNEMSATVNEIAQNANDAANSASKADSSTQDGRSVVQSTIDAIESVAVDVNSAADVIRNLSQDTDNIGSVLDVIRGIAEQTNLLALNAAIEAARAGEQGRGFAVVADEVRTLASRTQQSTQEIQEMIESLQTGAQEAVKVMDVGQQKVKESVEKATQAGVSLDAITQEVAAISDMNTLIASAAEEQNAVTEDINRNVVEISSISNQSAQSASQVNSASEELARLSADLQREVMRFKV